MPEIIRDQFERDQQATHFEVVAAERVGVSGPGKIPLNRIADLNGLILPIARIDVEPDSEHEDFTPRKTIFVYPEAVVSAYAAEDLHEPVVWWSGYASASVNFEDGRMIPGEISFSEVAGRLVAPPEATRSD
jgi:hypothetical protein